MKGATARFLAAHEQALALLHRAAAMPDSRFPIDLTQGVATPLDHLARTRHAARILAVEAILAAENGKSHQAVKAVQSSFGLGRCLANEPILTSQLVRMACHAMAVSSLERVLNRTSLTDDQLGALTETLRAADDPEAMARAFIGERAQGYWAFQHAADPHVNLLPNSPTAVLRKASGLADRDFAAYLEIMDDYIKVLNTPLPQRLRESEAVDAKTATMSRRHTLTRLLASALHSVVVADARELAPLRVALTAVAVERYRLRHGVLPDTLDDLVPAFLTAVPADPIDGKPIRYKRLKNGYCVYSIGQDAQDDGGSTTRIKKDARGRGYRADDIPFTLGPDPPEDKPPK